MTLSTWTVIRNYTGQLLGMTAWAIQRVTGILLLFYLLLHVETVRQLSEGPAAFNRALATYATPLFRLLEIGLLATVILHALNGIRLTMLDFGVAHRKQRKLFWYLAVGTGAALFIAGALPMFLFSVLRR